MALPYQNRDFPLAICRAIALIVLGLTSPRGRTGSIEIIPAMAGRQTTGCPSSNRYPLFRVSGTSTIEMILIAQRFRYANERRFRREELGGPREDGTMTDSHDG